jgi:Transposase
MRAPTDLTPGKVSKECARLPSGRTRSGGCAMRTSHFREEQISGILRLAEAGQTVAEVCRQQGISEATS